jgi:hypothetical protein
MSKRANIVSSGIFQPILSLSLMCDSVTLDNDVGHSARLLLSIDTCLFFIQSRHMLTRP